MNNTSYVFVQIKIITDIRVVSENQIRSVSNMFLKNSDTDHFTDLIRAFWAIDQFSDLYTFGCVFSDLSS